MFCIYCGIDLPLQAKYCFNCGKEVYNSAPSKLNNTVNECTIEDSEEEMSFSEKYTRLFDITYIYGPDGGMLDRQADCKLINNAKEPVSKIYTWISPLHNGYATVNIGGEYYYGKNNLTGEYSILCGKWGVIDENGKEVCPPIYDYIGYISRDGIALVNQGGDIIEVSNGWDHNAVCIGGKYGFINKTGELICDLKYDSADGFYNKFGKVNIGASESIASDLNDCREATYKKTEGGKWGIINKDGQEIIPCIYEKLDVKNIPILISKHKNEDISF